jgi:hypothetical protein
MVDDANLATGSELLDVSVSHMQIELNGGNSTPVIWNDSAAYSQNIHFDGGIYTPRTITSREFLLDGPGTNFSADWVPANGTFSGATMVTSNAQKWTGLHIKAPLPAATIIGGLADLTPVTGTDGSPSYIAQGSDGQYLGTTFLAGPSDANQIDVSSITIAGAQVSTNSRSIDSTFTSSATSSATHIATMTGPVARIEVTGVFSGAIFWDTLEVSNTAVLSSACPTVTADCRTIQGSPATRTYSMSAGVLSLAMSSGTYAIQAREISQGAQE